MPRWNLEALTSNQDKFDFAKFKLLLVAYAKENTALVIFDNKTQIFATILLSKRTFKVSQLLSFLSLFQVPIRLHQLTSQESKHIEENTSRNKSWPKTYLREGKGGDNLVHEKTTLLGDPRLGLLLIAGCWHGNFVLYFIEIVPQSV